MKISDEISILEIQPGMILDKDVFYHKNLLLAKGSVIKSNYIEQLRLRGITRVNVLAEKTSHAEILANPVQKFYSETYAAVGNILDNFKKEQPITSSEIFPVVENILETVFNNQNSVLLLTGFNGNQNYLFSHSLNVCVYSLITAKSLNLDYEDIVNLGMGALLHDLGKIKIPDQILLKPGSLTQAEFEIVKKHSRYGYEMVLKITGFKRNIAQIILQHHERCDGSGYPNNLTSPEITKLSKIVSIADIYDALTSDRIYNKRILPHEAAEYLLCISNSLIDSEITQVFLKNVALYPSGCQVMLNNHQVAVVVDPNVAMPLRPILKIITDQDGNPLQIPVKCELQSHPHLAIVNIFN